MLSGMHFLKIELRIKCIKSNYKLQDYWTCSVHVTVVKLVYNKTVAFYFYFWQFYLGFICSSACVMIALELIFCSNTVVNKKIPIHFLLREPANFLGWCTKNMWSLPHPMLLCCKRHEWILLAQTGHQETAVQFQCPLCAVTRKCKSPVPFSVAFINAS